MNKSFRAGDIPSQEEVDLGDQTKIQASWVNCWDQNTVVCDFRATRCTCHIPTPQSLSTPGTAVPSYTSCSCDGLHICSSRTHNLLEREDLGVTTGSFNTWQLLTVKYSR